MQFGTGCIGSFKFKVAYTVACMSLFIRKPLIFSFIRMVQGHKDYQRVRYWHLSLSCRILLFSHCRWNIAGRRFIFLSIVGFPNLFISRPYGKYEISHSLPCFPRKIVLFREMLNEGRNEDSIIKYMLGWLTMSDAVHQWKLSGRFIFLGRSGSLKKLSKDTRSSTSSLQLCFVPSGRISAIYESIFSSYSFFLFVGFSYDLVLSFKKLTRLWRYNLDCVGLQILFADTNKPYFSVFAIFLF